MSFEKREWESSLSMLELSRSGPPTAAEAAHVLWERAEAGLAAGSASTKKRPRDHEETTEDDDDDAVIDLTTSGRVNGRGNNDDEEEDDDDDDDPEKSDATKNNSQSRHHPSQTQQQPLMLARNSSPAPASLPDDSQNPPETVGGPHQPPDRRRQERNLREQERAQKIAHQIAGLKDLMPEEFLPSKTDKSSILESVRAYILQVQQDHLNGLDPKRCGHCGKSLYKKKAPTREGHPAVVHPANVHSGSNMSTHLIITKSTSPHGSPPSGSRFQGGEGMVSQSQQQLQLQRYPRHRGELPTTHNRPNRYHHVEDDDDDDEVDDEKDMDPTAPVVMEARKTYAFHPEMPVSLSQFSFMCSVTTDMKGLFLDCNRAFEELIGYSRAELVQTEPEVFRRTRRQQQQQLAKPQQPAATTSPDHNNKPDSQEMRSPSSSSGEGHPRPGSSSTTPPPPKPHQKLSLFHILHPEERRNVLIQMMAMIEDASSPGHVMPPANSKLWNGAVMLIDPKGNKLGRVQMFMGLVRTQNGQPHNFHCLLSVNSIPSPPVGPIHLIQQPAPSQAQTATVVHAAPHPQAFQQAQHHGPVFLISNGAVPPGATMMQIPATAVAAGQMLPPGAIPAGAVPAGAMMTGVQAQVMQAGGPMTPVSFHGNMPPNCMPQPRPTMSMQGPPRTMHMMHG